MPDLPEPAPQAARPRTRASWIARQRGAEHRMRASGGPVDSATYACDCGETFQAAVSTQVRCPSCGDTQAW